MGQAERSTPRPGVLYGTVGRAGGVDHAPGSVSPPLRARLAPSARHRREALAYLETLGDEDLQRKARIPLFRQLLGTEEVTMPTWARVFFAVHWGDHADQLAKIRKAVGLPEAG